MILKSPMNALHNVTNPYQGQEKQCYVCIAPSFYVLALATVLYEKYQYNTRSAGVSDYALIPVNTKRC